MNIYLAMAGIHYTVLDGLYTPLVLYHLYRHLCVIQVPVVVSVNRFLSVYYRETGEHKTDQAPGRINKQSVAGCCVRIAASNGEHIPINWHELGLSRDGCQSDRKTSVVSGN